MTSRHHPYGRRFKKITLMSRMIKVGRMLEGKTREMLLALPPMTNKDILAAMQVLNTIMHHAYIVDPSNIVMIGLTIVENTLKHGLCGASAFGLGLYGCFSKDIDTKVRYGQLAIEIIERFRSSSRGWLTRVHLLAHGLLLPLKHPLQDCLYPLVIAQKVGMETGDVEHAHLTTVFYCLNALDAGSISLDVLERDLMEFSKRFKMRKHNNIHLLQSCMDFIRCIMGRHDPIVFLDDTSRISKLKDVLSIGIVYYQKVVIAFLFGQYKRAATEFATKSLDHFRKQPGDIYVLWQCHFFSTLSCLAVLRHDKPKNPTKKMIRVVRRAIKRFEQYANWNPTNCASRLYLLQAEMAAIVARDFGTASLKYKSALAMSSSSASSKESHIPLLEYSLGKELEARYLMLSSGDVEGARQRFMAACASYRKWGGLGKANHLEREMRGLFPEYE
mmetsp:Transcript_14713/g.34023  ORF Transcript_14713/g.34023 Transcript_14713/m.34023 type:complete len:445 (+) Transcript_14713:2-1336(+)